jgi:hypothetical protein
VPEQKPTARVILAAPEQKPAAAPEQKPAAAPEQKPAVAQGLRVVPVDLLRRRRS